MSTVISRRSFLKCTGVSAAALGAASLLGGCQSNGDDTVVEVKVGDTVRSWNGLGVQLTSVFHLTQDQVAKRVGKSRSAVENSLRLQKLPEDVKTLVEDGGLSAGHARALLGISDEKLLSETAAKAAAGKLTVRAVEKIAADSEKPEKRTKISHKDSFYKEIEISLESRLGRRVTVTAGKNKGTLNLEFYDKDDLSALAQKLTKE